MAESPGFRTAAMEWLDQRPPNQRVEFSWLRGFEYQGETVPLMDRQRGIRKPRDFDMLEGGIQAVHDTKLAVVPGAKAARPSTERLEKRYAEFLAVC